MFFKKPAAVLCFCYQILKWFYDSFWRASRSGCKKVQENIIWFNIKIKCFFIFCLFWYFIQNNIFVFFCRKFAQISCQKNLFFCKNYSQKIYIKIKIVWRNNCRIFFFTLIKFFIYRKNERPNIFNREKTVIIFDNFCIFVLFFKKWFKDIHHSLFIFLKTILTAYSTAKKVPSKTYDKKPLYIIHIVSDKKQVTTEHRNCKNKNTHQI